MIKTKRERRDGRISAVLSPPSPLSLSLSLKGRGDLGSNFLLGIFDAASGTERFQFARAAHGLTRLADRAAVIG